MTHARESTSPPVRKKLPKHLAHIDADICTGCEACLNICPATCIDFIPGESHPRVQAICVIQHELCLGCSLCERFCPRNAIHMVPVHRLTEVVAEKRGPRHFLDHHHGRILRIAEDLAERALHQRPKT